MSRLWQPWDVLLLGPGFEFLVLELVIQILVAILVILVVLSSLHLVLMMPTIELRKYLYKSYLSVCQSWHIMLLLRVDQNDFLNFEVLVLELVVLIAEILVLAVLPLFVVLALPMTLTVPQV